MYKVLLKFDNMHIELLWKKYCTSNKPEADVSGVDLEVEVLAILVYSNYFSYYFDESFKALFACSTGRYMLNRQRAH